MNPNLIKRLFPNASKSFIKGNIDTDNTGEIAQLERNIELPSLEKNKVKKGTAELLHIKFESVRKRLLDPDNISEKWILDCLRFGGIIQGDEPDKITIETTQRKCIKGEQEKTIIQIFSK